MKIVNKFNIKLYLFFFNINNKRIMNNLTNDINLDIDIHQKRAFLEDSKDDNTHVLTNIFIYASFYYPHTKVLLKKIVDRLLVSHIDTLY